VQITEVYIPSETALQHSEAYRSPDSVPELRDLCSGRWLFQMIFSTGSETSKPILQPHWHFEEGLLVIMLEHEVDKFWLIFQFTSASNLSNILRSQLACAMGRRQLRSGLAINRDQINPHITVVIPANCNQLQLRHSATSKVYFRPPPITPCPLESGSIPT
jgi:hypothetical protein